MTALSHYTPGFRLIDGDQLNDMVDVVNNLSGGGTAGPITASTLTASGVASFANGLVGTPSITFTSDTDTGFYRIGANSLGIAVGGALVGTWASTGLAANVDGILGGNTPAAATVTTLTASTGVNGILGNATPAAATVTALTTSGNVALGSAVVALSSLDNTLTAHAGGGQGSALALTKAVNVVTIVGSANDSVKLPAPTTVGQVVVVVNAAAANSMQVFGAGTDTINGVATATGVAQAAGKTGIFVAVTTGAAAIWWRLLSA